MRLGLTAPDRPQWRPIALTKDEYSLLIAFLDAPQRPLSREYLLQATRVHEEILDRAVDVQIWLDGNRRPHRLHRPESLVALGSVGASTVSRSHSLSPDHDPSSRNRNQSLPSP
jgi:Transcriptional regulatory protein, C terminal